MITYRILEANSAKELVLMVNEELKRNHCTLIGGAIVRQDFVARNEWITTYIQTMTIEI